MAATKQIHIEAMHTAIPLRLTGPGQSRPIAVSAPLQEHVLQSRSRVVLYYKTSGEDEWCVSSVAAWARESLSAALTEHPELAGRLRREREGEGLWEVKFNDAGVRLVHAKVEMSMAEFLAAEEREAREEKLAYWVDVDRENPDFSALFYFQVTEFPGGGFSIGISCSLLLAGPLLLTQFLKKWAIAHNQLILDQELLPKTPIFHLDYFRNAKKRPTYLKSTTLDSGTTNSTTATTNLIRVPWNPDQHEPVPYDTLVSQCIVGPVSEFLLIVSDPVGDLKVELCRLVHSDTDDDFKLDPASWDEFGLGELALAKGDNPVHVSYRVVSSSDELALVVVMLPPDDIHSAPDLMVVATAPKRF